MRASGSGRACPREWPPSTREDSKLARAGGTPPVRGQWRRLIEELPRKFGRYRLTALLGRGGQASVFRGESEPIAGVIRNVAIKRIHDQSEEAIRLLVEEARIWVRLQHPNIVTVVDFGEEDGDWFLALELVDGMSASMLLERLGPLPVSLALCIGERVARALGHAHAHKDEQGRASNVVHRDVKPANILISRQGVVKLTDFGIARGAFRQTQTTAGMVKGSCGYFSPEQARGDELDARSDLFSLGCSLFELLTGRTPVPETREEALRAAASGRIEKPPDTLPGPVRELLSALLAPDRIDRPSNAGEVARRIHALLAPDDPDELALELGRFIGRALDQAGVLPEEAPSLVPTKPSDSLVEKTRISKPPVRQPEKTAPEARAPSRTVSAVAGPRVLLPEPPTVVPPSGGFPFRDLMLPIAGVSVAIGAVLAAVIPTRDQRAHGTPSPTPAFLSHLITSPTPALADAESLYAAFAKAQRENSLPKARTLAEEFTTRFPTDPRWSVVHEWAESHALPK